MESTAVIDLFSAPFWLTVALACVVMIPLVGGSARRLAFALINLGLGLATAFAMMWCGMPNPFLWGTVAALLNFIPYAGPTTTLVILTVVALVSFDTLPRVFAVAGSFVALTAIEGQVIQPLLV